jgi:galactosylceramidase
MITAVEPWSGHYPVDDEDLAVVYATAHVTQFTEVGWHYLPVGAGSGSLPQGGFYVTLVDPQSNDFTMNVVKIDESHAPCTRPHLPSFNVSSEQVTFKLAESMKAPAKLAVWYSNFEMAEPVVFKKMPDVSVVNGQFSLSVPVGSFFTISTITDATKGISYKPPPSSIQFPLPWVENMEEVEPSQVSTTNPCASLLSGTLILSRCHRRRSISLIRLAPTKCTTRVARLATRF